MAHTLNTECAKNTELADETSLAIAAEPTTLTAEVNGVATADMNQRPSTILVSESFTSRQGEGKLTGVHSYFIRTSGCNLRCWFCDTPYASWNPVGQALPLEEIVEAALAGDCGHVVLTGGEPLLPKGVGRLSESLMDAGLHLTIETAGTIDKPIECDLLSLSPKLAASTPEPEAHPRWSELHEQRRMPIATMRRLIDAAKDFQLKFVVGDKDQFDEVQDVVDQLAVAPGDVFIMPMGVTIEHLDSAKHWLEPWAGQAGYRYCDRMQIRWFGNRRGT